jgi:hypothetical protein
MIKGKFRTLFMLIAVFLLIFSTLTLVGCFGDEDSDEDSGCGCDSCDGCDCDDEESDDEDNSENVGT